MNKKRYEFLLILPYPTLKKRAFGNVLLDALSCGLRREAESFFPQTEFMPFKFKYNSHFDNILKIWINFFNQFDSPTENGLIWERGFYL